MFSSIAAAVLTALLATAVAGSSAAGSSAPGSGAQVGEDVPPAHAGPLELLERALGRPGDLPGRP
ncbi:hypothetical protein [Kineococcus glutinatus]|uniref:Uncharacterized protein n=1 Tax=Kineococcus glutinatus TaxID=1070872 RepID=A0ABP9I731_9ACTN